jgi:hypothetical protein
VGAAVVHRRRPRRSAGAGEAAADFVPRQGDQESRTERTGKKAGGRDGRVIMPGADRGPGGVSCPRTRRSAT